MELKQLLIALIAIWVSARLLGQLFTSLGRPAMLGELIAGVLVGSHVLGLVPDHEFIHLLAQVGVLVLLFEVGLETDLIGLVRVGPKSIAVAAAGMVLPMAGGYFLARAMGLSTNGCLMLAGALSATSIAVTSYALSQIGASQTEEGRIIVGAAVMDDVLGLVVLGVVSKVASAGEVTWGFGLAATGRAVGFLLVAIVLGSLLARPLLNLVDRMTVRGALTSAALAFALAWAVLAEYAGSAPLVGAFAAGVVLARTHRATMIQERLRPIASVFTPIFFASIGSFLDPRLLNPLDPAMRPAQLMALAVVAVAAAGKFASGYVVWGRGLRRSFIGLGMVPRGEVGLIFAQLGNAGGVLTPSAFAALIIMVFVTTLVPPAFLGRLAPGPVAASAAADPEDVNSTAD
jgi:Kef-type K+ transport system membrane component KefB